MAWLKDLLSSKGSTSTRRWPRSDDPFLRGNNEVDPDAGIRGFFDPEGVPIAGTSNLFNQGLALYIEHVPTGYFVEFPAMLESMSDAYITNWVQEKVYGRMDPIGTFSDTNRAISLSWAVVSNGIKEGALHLKKINGLISFMYPLYKEQGKGGGAILNMGPLLKIKFGNLIQNSQTGGGLLGFVNGITFDPEMEAGMWVHNPTEEGSMGTGGIEYIPKVIRLNMELQVVHEHSLGWKNTGDGTYAWRGEAEGENKIGFPFGVAKANTDQSNISKNESKQKGFDPNSPGAAAEDKATEGS